MATVIPFTGRRGGTQDARADDESGQPTAPIDIAAIVEVLTAGVAKLHGAARLTIETKAMLEVARSDPEKAAEWLADNKHRFSRKTD